MGIIAAFAVPHPPLLIPGVGGDSRLQVQKTEQAFKEVAARSAALCPETLVVFSPHAILYSDYFHISPGSSAEGNFSVFGSGATYKVEYDQEFVASLEALLESKGIPAGTEGEREPALDHGTMVPLHFFGQASGDEGGAGKEVKLVRIGLSGLSLGYHRELGRAVKQIADTLDRRTVVIASGDLSHKLLASGPYGFTPEGPEFDKEICAALEKGSVEDMMAISPALSDAAAECGLRSFIMMGGALDAYEFKPELLSYEGPFGVGYAVAAYAISGAADIPAAAASEEDNNEKSLPVALAHQTLKSYYDDGGERPTLDTPQIVALLARLATAPGTKEDYDELAQKRAGAFVSLHKWGELRGCIGTIVSTKENVLAEIIQNAVSAAVEDPRFQPVKVDELEDLEIKVDILGEAEPVIDRSMLDAERYGVIVSLGYRRGLLLPALEGVDTPDEQISIALNKARIQPNEPYELERFEVVRYT